MEIPEGTGLDIIKKNAGKRLKGMKTRRSSIPWSKEEEDGR